jgi:phosphoenolpyruvate carboxylase
MTQSVEDLLAVYLLAKYAGFFLDPEAREICSCRIVPLFETIADLRAAPRIMKELLSIPLVRRSVADQGGFQEVMLGYSCWICQRCFLLKVLVQTITKCCLAHR